MDARIRIRLERAGRVLEFSRQHPSDLDGYRAAVARLEERLARASAVAQAEIGNRLEGSAAVVKRAALREGLTADLRYLSGIARTAGTESVGTPIVIRYPGPQRSQYQFLVDGRLAVAKAQEVEEQLVKFGLPAGHLAALAAGLDEFERLLAEREDAGRGHVAARLELQALVRELRVVVAQLDTINRHRFRRDLAAMGAWRSARDIRVGPRKPTAPAGELPAPPALPPGPAGLGHAA